MISAVGRLDPVLICLGQSRFGLLLVVERTCQTRNSEACPSVLQSLSYNVGLRSDNSVDLGVTLRWSNLSNYMHPLM